MPCTVCLSQPHRLHRHRDGSYAAPCGSGEHPNHTVVITEWGYKCDCPNAAYVRWQDEGRCSHILEVKAYIAYQRPHCTTIAVTRGELFDELTPVVFVPRPPGTMPRPRLWVVSRVDGGPPCRIIGRAA